MDGSSKSRGQKALVLGWTQEALEAEGKEPGKRARLEIQRGARMAGGARHQKEGGCGFKKS